MPQQPESTYLLPLRQFIIEIVERSGVQSTSTSHLPTDNAQKLSQIGLESSINSLRMHAGHIFATLTNFCELILFFAAGEFLFSDLSVRIRRNFHSLSRFSDPKNCHKRGWEPKSTYLLFDIGTHQRCQWANRAWREID